MISSLAGVVLTKSADQIVLEVAGIGYSVWVPTSLAHTAAVGTNLRLHTHLIVREDALSLYGFAEPDEQATFGHLITVTGVGPKSALGVLSHLSIEQIVTAIADDDDAPFRRV